MRLFAAAALLSGCVSLPIAPKPAPTTAPEAAGAIAIQVSGDVGCTGGACDSDWWMDLRARLPEGLRSALLKAGYSVVKEGSETPLFVARLSATDPNLYYYDSSGSVVGTLKVALERGGRVVEEAEITTPIPAATAHIGNPQSNKSAELERLHVRPKDYVGFASTSLVNDLNNSKRVIAFAGEVGAPAGKSVKSAPGVVAVFDVEDAGKRIDADTLSQLTDYLAVTLAQQGRYRVVPREQLRERLRVDKAESYKACFDESCQIELGKAVSAEKSLATKLLKVGSTCVITSTLFDLKSETTERAASAKTTCDENGLIGGVDQIVAQFLEPQ